MHDTIEHRSARIEPVLVDSKLIAKPLRQMPDLIALAALNSRSLPGNNSNGMTPNETSESTSVRMRPGVYGSAIGRIRLCSSALAR